MPTQSWCEALRVVQADGTAIVSSTTETIIFPDTTIPANFLKGERNIHVIARGKYSSTATPTLIFAVRLGGVAGTVLCQSGPITVASGITNAIWEVDVEIQVRVAGSSGSLMAMGKAIVGSGHATPAVGSATGAPGFSNMGSAANQITPAAVTVDLTVDQALSVTAKWSANSASNTLTGLMLKVENPN